MSMAVSPSLFLIEVSTPAATSLDTASDAPTLTAYISAVHPSPSFAFKSTFFAISCVTDIVFFLCCGGGGRKRRKEERKEGRKDGEKGVSTTIRSIVNSRPALRRS